MGNFTRWTHRLKAFSTLNRLTLLIFVIFIQACTSLPPVDLSKIKHANQIQNYNIKGKIAFKTTQQAKSATFYWQQQANTYHITLSTYLGIQLAEIKGTPNHIEINADGDNYQSNDPQGLIARQIGWRLPVQHLSDWVKGIHNGVVINTHDNGLAKKVLVRTSSTEEWTLTYLSYQTIGNLQLPQKIKCQTPTLTVMLQINQWDQINQ